MDFHPREIIIRARMTDFLDQVNLYVGYLDEQNHSNYAKPLEYELMTEPFHVDPTVTISRENAQFLMDEFWKIGFRPTEGTGSAGALDAVKYHLEDMRRLVFDETGKRA